MPASSPVLSSRRDTWGTTSAWQTDRSGHDEPGGWQLLMPMHVCGTHIGNPGYGMHLLLYGGSMCIFAHLVLVQCLWEEQGLRRWHHHVVGLHVDGCVCMILVVVIRSPRARAVSVGRVGSVPTAPPRGRAVRARTRTEPRCRRTRTIARDPSASSACSRRPRGGPGPRGCRT